MPTTESLTIFDTNANITKHNFKSATVQKSVSTIIEAVTTAQSTTGKLKDEFNKARDTAYKTIAPVLAKLKANNAHKTEGFDTWSQFVEAVMPLTSRQATSILTYNRAVSEVPALADFSVANVNELASANPDAIKAAIESHEITPDTKQTELSTFAANHRKSEKPKVEPRFNIWAVTDEKMKYIGVIKADFATKFGLTSFTVLPASDDGSPRRFIAYNNSGNCTMGAFVPYVKESGSKKTVKKESFYDSFREANDWAANLPDDAIQSIIDRARAEQGK